jgi:hypothetical protein
MSDACVALDLARSKNVFAGSDKGEALAISRTSEIWNVRVRYKIAMPMPMQSTGIAAAEIA